ncbi:hypothetical protein CARUB_v10010970mg [Capsella rubella]|uniref:RING-type E3 ubiquitin transferase n=1 Tax=Capsella rubella TaxID=81985 RepID=R0IHT5_9BRAS|nr:putative RING-H2 finger protein ATL37 isoform X1 [Capsella rubella]EOA36433.1 hypothetical protein CARUB_v10010970mg [Capsella rubella]
MRIELRNYIIRNPQPEDVGGGTITISAKVVGYNRTFTASSLVSAFIDEDNDECSSKEDFNYFLMESGISDDDTADAITELINNVYEVTSPASNDYSPGYDLLVYLLLVPTSQIEDAFQIEEAVRVWFDETNNIPLRPASKLVVKSLARKIHDKVTSTGEECTICFEEFDNDERRVVTLPCGHDFDYECVVKWFETNHTCPLCRFKLPCED